MSKDASWSTEGAKIIGRYLTAYLSELAEADSG